MGSGAVVEMFSLALYLYGGDEFIGKDIIYVLYENGRPRKGKSKMAFAFDFVQMVVLCEKGALE